MKIHIPLKSKSFSGDTKDNFLFQIENIYLMDNHRLALWAWFQEIDLAKKYNFIHIDAHPDLSINGVNEYDRKIHPIEKMDLNTYRNLIQSSINSPLFRWDNYIQFLLVHYKEILNASECYSFTQKMGSFEKLYRDLSPIYLLKELNQVFNELIFINDNKWIVNLDLDYFFSSSPHKMLMFDREFIKEIGSILRDGLNNKMIEVFTIAFSPECCGSWENAMMCFNVLNEGLGILDVEI